MASLPLLLCYLFEQKCRSPQSQPILASSAGCARLCMSVQAVQAAHNARMRVDCASHNNSYIELSMLCAAKPPCACARVRPPSRACVYIYRMCGIFLGFCYDDLVSAHLRSTTSSFLRNSTYLDSTLYAESVRNLGQAMPISATSPLGTSGVMPADSISVRHWRLKRLQRLTGLIRR